MKVTLQNNKLFLSQDGRKKYQRDIKTVWVYSLQPFSHADHKQISWFSALAQFCLISVIFTKIIFFQDCRFKIKKFTRTKARASFSVNMIYICQSSENPGELLHIKVKILVFCQNIMMKFIFIYFYASNFILLYIVSTR